MYPSSVAIDSDYAELREYADAKKNGEIVCKELSKKLKLEIISMRLPRMHTDQTNSVIKVPDSGIIEIILPIVRQMTERQKI